MMDAANNLEAAADIIETNLVALGLTRVEQNLVVSAETRAGARGVARQGARGAR